MDKVTVIGGSGFVGSHVVDELSQRGYAVTVFDREPSPWISGNQHMVRACEDTRYLYHFAGIADIAAARAWPFQTIEANVMGVTAALEVARSIGIARFVYASTMYVYSSAGSFYRASKQAVEGVIEAYAEQRKQSLKPMDRTLAWIIPCYVMGLCTGPVHRTGTAYAVMSAR